LQERPGAYLGARFMLQMTHSSGELQRARSRFRVVVKK
jgi:hypothetical protein